MDVALVTGADGFIGRHLREHLEERGDKVIATDVRSGGVDLCDQIAIEAAVRDAAPEIVYHLGGQGNVGRSWLEPSETVRVNVLGTLHVLLAARAGGVRRVVFMSSAEVYGAVVHEHLLTEDDDLRPLTPYGASKAAAEALCIQAGQSGELEVVRARGFTHLGPGQRAPSLATAVAKRLLAAQRAGERTIPVGSLGARRDVTDVRDVVRALRLLALRGRAGQAYNVCSGLALSSAEIVRALVAAVGDNIEAVVDPALIRPLDNPWVVGDPGRLQADCGWRPTIPLERTITDLLASLNS